MKPTKGLNIDLIERDPDKLENVYQIGIEDMKNRIEELKEYLK